MLFTIKEYKISKNIKVRPHFTKIIIYFPDEKGKCKILTSLTEQFRTCKPTLKEHNGRWELNLNEISLIYPHSFCAKKNYIPHSSLITPTRKKHQLWKSKRSCLPNLNPDRELQWGRIIHGEDRIHIICHHNLTKIIFVLFYTLCFCVLNLVWAPIFTFSVIFESVSQLWRLLQNCIIRTRINLRINLKMYLNHRNMIINENYIL